MKNRTRLRLLAISALLLCLLAITPIPEAFAKLATNTIDPVATLSANGRRIVLTGPVACTQEEWVDIRVTVTQRSTGAVAEGRVRLLGSTQTQQWTVEALTHGRARFEEGPATAVAIAVTSRRGIATDAHQWLVAVTLDEP